MSQLGQPPQTALCTHTPERIYVRDVDLVEALIGKVTFTQMMFFDILGRMPTQQETFIVDAVLVTLIEHGMTPSALAARLAYSCSPEALQGGVAAGLLAAGSQILGTIENAAQLLQRICSDPNGVEAAAQREAMEHKRQRKALPGFGHPNHKPDDPRTAKLFELARTQGVPGNYIAALQAMSRAVDAVYGKHITINATASVAALLMEIKIPPELMRGFAVISRAAGLVAHIREEQLDPAMTAIWQAAEAAVLYSGRAAPRKQTT